jgi:hypothetical protein
VLYWREVTRIPFHGLQCSQTAAGQEPAMGYAKSELLKTGY